MDPDMFPQDSERLFREFLQHGRFHASPRAPEQMPAHAHWAPPPYQRGPAYPPRRAPAYDHHHSQPAAPQGPFFYMADGTGWNPALQPMMDHVRRYAAWHNGPPPTTQYGTVPIAGLWPNYDPAQDIHARGSRGDSNWPGQAAHGSATTTPPSFPAYTDGSDRHTQAGGGGTCPRAPESASAEQHKNPAARAAGRGSVSSASTATSTSSRSSRGAATVAFTDSSNSAPPAPRPFTQDYSLRGPDGAGEPTRCVVSLVVDGRVNKYIYISPSVCPSCSAHDDDDNNDDHKGKGRTGYYYYCTNPRRRGSFTSTAAIINGQVGHGPGPGHVGPGHRSIRLSARTAASDEGLEIFLKLLHTPDPSSSSSRHLLPFLSTDGSSSGAARAFAHVAMADAQFGAAGRHRASLAAWAARWADELERRVLLRADGGCGLGRLARSGGGGRLAALLYAAGRLRLPGLWRLAVRAAVLHCPVDADGAVCAPCDGGGGGGGGDGDGEPYRLFRLVPDRGMEDAARRYCAAVKETRRQVVVDIIDAIYDTREAIRRKKTGYGQRDPLKAQLACLGLWPGHHDAGYRSHPAVRESVAALMGRVKRAAAAAAARGDNAELILLVDRIRAIVDAVHLPLP